MKKINLKSIRAKRVGGVNGWAGRIEVNPKVALGRPVIRGTRLTVEFVLELLGQGMGSREIVEEFPQLEEADILAAINYAQLRVREERIYPLRLEHVPA